MKVASLQTVELTTSEPHLSASGTTVKLAFISLQCFLVLTALTTLETKVNPDFYVFNTMFYLVFLNYPV